MALFFVKYYGHVRSVFDKEELAYQEVCDHILSGYINEDDNKEFIALYEAKQYKHAYEIGVQFHDTYKVEQFYMNLNESEFVQEN
jgi:hypothetical protein